MEMPAIRKGSFLVLFIGILMVIFKFWLISEDEIVARLLSYDQSWFINAANHLIQGEWFGPYGFMTLIRPPAYPIWIFLNHLMGFPLRIGIELLLVLSIFVFSASLVKAGFPRWMGLLIFAVILFFPLTFKMNNEAESETLYFPFLLFSTGFMIFLLMAPTVRRGIFFAVALGISLTVLWHSRHEHLILIFYIVFFAFLHLFTKNLRRQSWDQEFIALFFILLPTFAIVSLSTLAISLKNCVNYRVFNTSEIFVPGYVSALNALASIDVKEPKRYASVPREARLLAYSASPTFQKLQPWMEGEVGKNWYQPGCVNSGLCDDLGSAWFQWALRESANQLGIHQSARQADSFYQAISDEISGACKNGKIPCHSSMFNFFGLLGSGVSGLIKVLPSEFLRLGHTLFYFMPISEERDFIQIPAEDRELYNRVAHRRPELTTPQPLLFKGKVLIDGWAVHFGEPLREIQLRDLNDNILGQTQTFLNRGDVKEHFIKSGRPGVPDNSGFHLEGDIPGSDPRPSFLVFIAQDGKIFKTSLRKDITEKDSFIYCIDSVSPQKLKFRIKNLIVETYDFWGGVLAWAVMPALLVLVLLRKRLAVPAYLPFVLALLAFVVAVRLALIGTYSAFVFFITPPIIRFLYPVAPIFYCLLILLSFLAFWDLGKGCLKKACVRLNIGFPKKKIELLFIKN